MSGRRTTNKQRRDERRKLELSTSAAAGQDNGDSSSSGSENEETSGRNAFALLDSSSDSDSSYLAEERDSCQELHENAGVQKGYHQAQNSGEKVIVELGYSLQDEGVQDKNENTDEDEDEDETEARDQDEEDKAEVDVESCCEINCFGDLAGRHSRNGSTIPASVIQWLEKSFGVDSKPTQVQSKSWALLLSKKGDKCVDCDLVAISKTGSGKTLGFLIPLLTELSHDSPDIDFTDGRPTPGALVVAPTRELANQNFQVANTIVTECKLGFEVGSALGGELFAVQAAKLIALRPRLLVATLGRLLSLCGQIPHSQLARQDQMHQLSGEQDECKSKAMLSLEKVTSVVFDEADRLLDLGFHEDVLQLSRAIPWQHASRRTRAVFTSATWSKSTDASVRELFPHINQLLFVTVDRISYESNTVSPSVTQRVEVLSQQGAPRVKRLVQVVKSELDESPESLVIVFTVFKQEAKEVGRQLNNAGIGCQCLQGGMSQTQRSVALANFRSSDEGTRVLVATDVAGRGIDVSNVDLVVNYSLGISIENYIHRCGRTGRAGRFGTAHTFVLKGKDDRLTPELCQVLDKAGQQIPIDLKLVADKETKRRNRQGMNLAAAGATISTKKESAPLSEEEEARQANRKKQLEASKAKKQRANAQAKKRKNRGRR